MTSRILVGDEESFILYAEKIVQDIQKEWHNKAMMQDYAVMDISARLEEIVYNETMKEFSISPNSAVWNKQESIDFYQDMCDKLILNLQTKQLNWKKVYEDCANNARLVFSTILKSDNDKRFRLTAQELQRQQQHGLGSMSGMGQVRTTSRPRKASTSSLTAMQTVTNKSSRGRKGGGGGNKKSKGAHYADTPKAQPYLPAVGQLEEGYDDGTDPTLTAPESVDYMDEEGGMVEHIGDTNLGMGFDDFGFDFDLTGDLAAGPWLEGSQPTEPANTLNNVDARESGASSHPSGGDGGALGNEEAWMNF